MEAPGTRAHPATAPLIEVREVSVRFGGIVALDRVSFDIASGSLFGLIGPNGAGKTTAFNCGAPGFHFTREKLESDIGPRLVNMVRNVEVALSGR